MQRGLLVAILLCGSGLWAVNRDFVLPIRLTNAHLGQVFLGCQQGATDAFDKGIDDLAPPPGIQTGYVGFVSTLPNSLLYKDVKSHGDLKEWRLSIQVYEGKPLKMSWQESQLPKFYSLTLLTGDGEVDMQKINHVEFTKDEPVAIVATLDLAAVTAAEKAEAEAAKAETAAPAPTPAPEPPAATPAPVPTPAKPQATTAAPVSPEKVRSGVGILVLAMGGLLLLVVIFAAVRRQ